jgi:hypothetical protein
MKESSFFKSILLFVAIFLFFSGAQTHIYGQLSYDVEKFGIINYKWSVTQQWNSTTCDCGETLFPGKPGRICIVILVKKTD